MMLTILRLLSLIPTSFRLQSELALENLALRQQLAVLNRRHRRPRLRKSDRVFWLLLSRFWSDWLALEKDAPAPRSVQPPANGRVLEIPEVGVLHHRYERRAA